MALKTWLGTYGGLWGQGVQWSPNGSPTAADDAAVTGVDPVANTTVFFRAQPFQTITGPGSAATLMLQGNTALAGAFSVGSLRVGTATPGSGGRVPGIEGGLVIGAGSSVGAGSVDVGFGFIQVAGAGASLSVAGGFGLGGGYPYVATSLEISGGGSVQAGSMDLFAYRTGFGFRDTQGTIRIDAASRMDLGTSGAAAAGTLLVEAGRRLGGAGSVTAANGIVNDGVIVATGGTLFLASPVSGAGKLDVGVGATLAPHGTTEAVRFLGATGTLMLYLVSNGGVPAFSDGVGVINGFGSGNRVVFDTLVYGSGVYGSGISASLTSVRYQAIGNGLGTLTLSSGLNVAGTLMVAGDYNGKAFQIAPEFPGGASILTVAPSGPPRGDAFLFTDAAGVSGAVAGEAYAGPVAGLDRQYIWPGTGGVALAATVGNVFLHGGVGDDALQVKGGFNVLDGGAGSNFLVGGTGGDGGADTFFVDGRGGAPVWSTVVNFHRGDAVTVFGFVAGVSTRPWSAAEGALGYAGATIHSELGGAGTGVNASLTFTGVSLADAQTRLSVTTGTTGGTPYLSVAYG